MKNLFALLYKNHLFLLFLLLEILSLTLAIQHNAFQRSTFIHSAHSISGNTYDVINNFSSYMDLKEKNALLADSLAKVRTQSMFSFLKRDTNFTKINDTLYQQQYVFVSAEVLHLTTHKINNYITLNKGSHDGIKNGMAVIGTNGIVGVVNGTTDNYCSVLSVLHSQSSIPCRLKKSKNIGFLIWNNRDFDYRHCLLKDIPLTAKIAKGDTVVTTENSNIFPGGIPVGKVVEAHLADESQSQDVTVELFLDYNILDHAFIIRDLMKDQKDSLQIKFQND